MNFNVTKETRGSSLNPIQAPIRIEKGSDPLFPLGYKFPYASLVNVVFDPKRATKRDGVDVIEPSLMFVFREAGKENQAIKYFSPIASDDDKAQAKQDTMNSYIKHFWDETIGTELMPEEGLAPKATNFAEFFKAVADNFNKVTEEKAVSGAEAPKQVKKYSTALVYIKQTYNGSNLQWPLFPNVIQKARLGTKAVPCELRINVDYDKLEPQSSERGGANVGGGLPPSGVEDLPFGDDGFPQL